MKKYITAFISLPVLGFTQDVGSDELGILASLLSGNIALAVGLVAGIFGLYIWLIEQRSWGLVMIILGAAATAFPGIFHGVYNGINPFISEVSNGGSRGTVNFTGG